MNKAEQGQNDVDKKTNKQKKPCASLIRSVLVNSYLPSDISRCLFTLLQSSGLSN